MVTSNRCTAGKNCTNTANMGFLCGPCYARIHNSLKPQVNLKALGLQLAFFVAGIALFWGVIWVVASVAMRVLS